MRKLIDPKNLFLYLSFVSLNAFTQNNLNSGQGNTQWKINGNIVDETNYIGTKNNFPLKFRANDIERLRITPDGLIGIGTLLPQAQLDVYGNVIFRNNFTLANIVLESNLSTKDIILTDGEGKITKGDLNQLLNEVYVPSRACREDQNGNIPNPSWANGTNKLFTVCDQVNVGIGTDVPNFKLHVVGTTYSSLFKGAESYLNGRMLIGSHDQNVGTFASFFIKNSTNDASIAIDHTSLNGDYKKLIFAEIQNPKTEIIKVNNPVLNYVPFLLTASGVMEIHNGVRKTFRLDENGLLKTRRIIVDQENWPDYVFEPTYKLRTLNEVEEYLLLNKHLPEVPAAIEVEQNGSDLGEMNAILLKKIEELTLYLIEQDKKLTQQALELETIKKQLK